MTDRQMRPDEYTQAVAIAQERARIEAERPACTTAADMTGARCTCATDCRNYWLHAKGLAGEGPSASH